MLIDFGFDLNFGWTELRNTIIGVIAIIAIWRISLWILDTIIGGGFHAIIDHIRELLQRFKRKDKDNK